MATAFDLQRQAGIVLAQQLRKEAMEPCSIPYGGLTSNVIQELEEMFRPTKECIGRAAEDGRGDYEYWCDHGRQTGTLMRYMATAWSGRGDPELYDRVGYIHDLDYLCFPHDAPRTQASGESAHPVPLALAMRKMQVCPAVILAVMEHAPYLGLSKTPSSRLSAALSAAEDLATIAALDPPFKGTDKLSDEANFLLKKIGTCKKIHRQKPVRVELSPDLYINTPLALVVNGAQFYLDM